MDNSALERWRRLDALMILSAVANYIKQDTGFKPRLSHDTTRWLVNVGGRDYEILCTGPKLLDTRAQHGGGGAIDLVMHLFKLDFSHAVALLKDKGL